MVECHNSVFCSQYVCDSISSYNMTNWQYVSNWYIIYGALPAHHHHHLFWECLYLPWWSKVRPASPLHIKFLHVSLKIAPPVQAAADQAIPCHHSHIPPCVSAPASTFHPTVYYYCYYYEVWSYILIKSNQVQVLFGQKDENLEAYRFCWWSWNSKILDE